MNFFKSLSKKNFSEGCDDQHNKMLSALLTGVCSIILVYVALTQCPCLLCFDFVNLYEF